MGWDKTKPINREYLKNIPGFIREVKEFLENALTDEGHEKYYRICTSATRPNPAFLGMLIFETDSENVYKCIVGGTDPTWKELGSYTGLSWQEPIKDRDLSAPPTSPETKSRYIVSQDTYAISYVNTTDKIFGITGNYAGRFAEGDTFEVSGSTGNDNIYIIADVTYNSGEGRTELTVSEIIPDDTIDGNILHSQGAWNGHYNDTAEALWESGTWAFNTKKEGMVCYCEDEAIFIFYNGTDWAKLSEAIGILAQTNVEKDETEAQTWDDPITDLKSNLNRIRHQIKTAVGEAWGTITHSIVDCWAKFHATTGHKHTGGANDAPKLDAANTHESPSANTHHNQSHTLASHSTKPHSALTGITANQHHNESHTLASHSTKPHSALTGVTADQHHNEKHDTDKHTNLEYDSASSSGLDFYYKAGRVRNDNAITNVAAGHVTLADDDVSYIEVDGSGVVTDNITGFTSGKIPLYEVTTASGAITDVVDKRTWLACRSVPAVPISFKIGWAAGDTYNQHFQIRIGTGNGAEGGSYIIDKESKDNQADWIHFSPDTVIQIPSSGIDYLHHGFLAQYTVGEDILAKGINYNIWKRVWDVTAEVYGDWDWLGSIVK